MVAVPLAGRGGLTEAELAAQRQAPEEGRVVDVEADRGALAERPRRAVGKRDRESAARAPRASGTQTGRRPPSTPASAPSRIEPATPSSIRKRGAGSIRTAVTGAPIPRPARTPACGGTGRASATAAGPASG